MIGTITLNPSIDQHILINKLIKDDAIRAVSIHRDPGGKGINVARAVIALGERTKAVNNRNYLSPNWFLITGKKVRK